MNEPLFRVDELTVSYPSGTSAVDGASLHAERGEIIALLGRNGAGKTTFLRACAGIPRKERVRVRGVVAVGGSAVTALNPRRCHRDGIILVPERDKVFPHLSVSEHLKLVNKGRTPANLRFEPLARLWKAKAGSLSGGERQMLGLEVAMAQRLKVLLVDELSLGLAPVIVKQLFARLRELADEQGVCVVLVEQDARSAIEISDRAYVLDHGRIVWHGVAERDSLPRITSLLL